MTAAQIETFYTALEEYAAWHDSAVEAPFGDKTDAAIAAYEALDAKVKDYFMRSRLASFSPESLAALDVQASRIEAISSENLTAKADDIADYPIARVTGTPEINLAQPINPAWASRFDFLRSVALKADVLTEADWNALGEQFGAYLSWKSSKAGAAVEPLGLDTVRNLLSQDKKEALLDLVAQDAALAEEASNIDMVDKFLHILRDFYRLLRNFVTLNDF